MPAQGTRFEQQPTVACPKCGEPVHLTEALAAPLLQATRADYEARLRSQQESMGRQQKELAQQREMADQQRAQLQQREAELKRKAEAARTALAAERADLAGEIARQTEANVTAQLAKRLAEETARIAKAEEQRAAQRFTLQLQERDRDRNDQAQQIAELSARLDKAVIAEADFKRREREFGDRERQLALTVEQEVSGRLEQVRATAASEAEMRLSLQLNDKERTIRELGNKLDEAVRKAQQGSQQAQGETLELVLEDQLRRHFPYDELQPVPKGEFGGDTVQVIRDSSGRECGRILWEFKRTKTWSPAWLPKLRGDQRSARADLAVLVTQAMPPDVQHFNEVDGIWVSSLACTLPVATALRASLLQLAGQRRNAEGQQTKSELMYAYLTGPQFRSRIEAIAERWSDMQDDLEAEKKATLKRWAKREMQLRTLLESTTGIYGDVQGIAGRDLAEIEGLEDTLLLTTEN